MNPPVDGVPPQTAVGSVHRLRHLTCPSARLAACLSPHSSPGSRQHPCGPGHEARYPAGYHGPRPGEGGPLPACSRCLSAAGIRYCGHPSPARDSAPLAIGLPPAARLPLADRDGIPRSAHVRNDRIGCPLYPGTSGAPTGRRDSRPAARRIPAASVLLPRRSSHLSEAADNEASTRVQVIHPPGLPLARSSRMTQELLRLFTPGSAPARAGPVHARRGGDRL
jgi:hypothetical protein